MFKDDILQIVVLLTGVLRGEKVELAAAVKKQQVRIQHLEEALEKATKEVGCAGCLALSSQRIGWEWGGVENWKSSWACHDGYHFLMFRLVQCIYACTRIYTFMHARTYAWICVHMLTCTHKHMHVCMHTHTHTHTHSHTHTLMHAHTHKWRCSFCDAVSV